MFIFFCLNLSFNLNICGILKLFLENFINRESEDCLVPLYDFITFLKKVDSICSSEAKEFVRRIIRSIFLTDKAPKFRVGKDCKRFRHALSRA